MTTHEFLNRLRSLHNIDHHMLPELTDEQWTAFRDNPTGFLLRCNDYTADAIMQEVEKCQTSSSLANSASLQTMLSMAYRLSSRLSMDSGSLRSGLRWCLDHSHECLDDHPSVLEQLKKILNDTDEKIGD